MKYIMLSLPETNLPSVVSYPVYELTDSERILKIFMVWCPISHIGFAPSVTPGNQSFNQKFKIPQT